MTSTNTAQDVTGFSWANAAVFVLAAALGLTLSLGLYVTFVSSQIARSDIPSTYKWLLLSELPGSRLIIESGSNSHIGLDTDAISEALGVTAINVADNGGYDIEQKAARIAKHTRPGDVVILPLEWVYYSRQSLTDDFVENLPALNRDYFNSVGWGDRMRLALSLPPASVFGFQEAGSEATDLGALSHIQSLYVATLTQPSGHVSYEAPRPLAAGVAGQTCDDYLFGPGPYKISDKFRRALKRFSKLKQTGVEVVFAWPVMVGDECFSSTSDIPAFAERIEQTVLDAGLSFIGRPDDALYPTHLRDDTPYHLIRAGTEIHTARFIDLLRAYGIRPAGVRHDTRTFVQARLYELECQTASLSSLDPMPLTTTLLAEDLTTLTHIDFVAGWWGHEPYGRWMRNQEAVLRLELPAGLAPGTHLRLSGMSAGGGRSQVQALIDGRLISVGFMGAGADLSLNLDGVPRGEVVELVLRLPDMVRAQSPYDRGENQDRRTLTLHLQSLSLVTSSEPRPVSKRTPKSQLVTGASESLNLGAIGFSDRLTFDDQWWPVERNGRWMKCCTAMVTVRLQEPLGETASLQILGGVFGGEALLEITVNDQTPVLVRFSRTRPAHVPLGAEVGASDLRIRLRFPDQSFESPLALGLSNDPRVMSGFIETIQITNTPLPAL
ncbi:MAG: hypothetical protein Hens3KO_10670 [Henriciella sp.]